MGHVDLGQSGSRTKQPRKGTSDRGDVDVDTAVAAPGEEQTARALQQPQSSRAHRGKHAVSYNAERIIGSGSFGVVFQATVVGSDEVVAIKKVLQDKRFKNRELQIMRILAKVCLSLSEYNPPPPVFDLIQVHRSLVF